MICLDLSPLLPRRLRQKLPEAAALGADVLYLGHIPGAPWRPCGMEYLFEDEFLSMNMCK